MSRRHYSDPVPGTTWPVHAAKAEDGGQPQLARETKTGGEMRSIGGEPMSPRRLPQEEESPAGGTTVSGRSRPPKTDGGPSDYASSVGRHAHEVVGLLLGPEAQELPDEPLGRAIGILGVTRLVISQIPARERRRAIGAEVAGAVAVYLRRFRLRSPWELMASEVPLGDKRVDLVYRNHTTGRVVIDELKFGLTPSLEAVDDQAEEYLRLGQARWGTQLLGVRVCLVSAPMRSTFHSASDGTTSSLATVALPGLRGRA
ncbi:MAG TPA: hypothetical protein VMW80_04040 [Candidatus Dormibacteraeota bacterium]|nr:hypothetical protein [Candidatus Dormibacteraeota bacterium]